jgi:hypothetical protein
MAFWQNFGVHFYSPKHEPGMQVRGSTSFMFRCFLMEMPWTGPKANLSYLDIHVTNCKACNESLTSCFDNKLNMLRSFGKGGNQE